MEEFELIIIGSGPGGYHAALRASQYGIRTALIEKKLLGGVCSNWGCIPTKALQGTAILIQDISEKAKEFGVNIKEPITIDFEQAVKRKNQVTDYLRQGIEGLLKKRNVPVYYGSGFLESGNHQEGFVVRIEPSGNSQLTETIRIKGKYVIIGVGSKPATLPQFNLDHKRILDSNDILEPNFTTHPKSIIFVGGGVIGCEFANIFASIGSKVTILEYMDSILYMEEKRAVNMLLEKFKKLNISVETSKNVISVENKGDHVEIKAVDAKIPQDKIANAETTTYEAELCVICISRKSSGEAIGAEALGIKIEKGKIVVNPDTLETDVKGIFAIGDVKGGMMLAHVASHEADVVVNNIGVALGKLKYPIRKPDYSAVPYTIFTYPEIAGVGISESKARKLGKKPLVGRFYYSSLGKAQCVGSTEGFLELAVDPDTDMILGAVCVGHSAPELISEIAVAIVNKINARELAHVIHSHPTISEMVLEAVEDVYGMAIHKIGRPKL